MTEPEISGPYADHPQIGELPVEVRMRIADALAAGKPIKAIQVLHKAAPSHGLATNRSIVESLPIIGPGDSPTSGPSITAPELASGQIDSSTTLRLYRDGTYTTTGLFLTSAPDTLVDLSYDTDSMRRKSASGRGVAAALTGGASLLAANNRGVLYVTVTGATRGAKTYTTKNPSDRILTGIRSLQAAANTLIGAPRDRAATPDQSPPVDMAAQLKAVADLHASGALTDEEFTAAKARLLGS
ncbi:SHOCT domain-containing protein [Gordonia sputi]|uniref:SHOCT domain-containing protein n=1 Tax=Gordonia TaxID=2053 RepID=UPI002043B202|nr:MULTISPECIES: SHOCT domain-containing protein [Gordonia]MCM3897083.1 SHOCT domain-containing protein [Gordonia sputi]